MMLMRWSLAGLLLVAAGCGSEAGGTDITNDPINSAGEDGGAGGGNGTTGGTGATGGSTGGAGSGNTDGTMCGGGTVRNERISPDILIVLDRSGSMNPGSNPDMTDRWTGSKNAVIASTAKYDQQIEFGLMVFPYIDTASADPCAGLSGIPLLTCQLQNAAGANSCAAGEVNVPVGPMAGAEIMQVLGPMTAGGGTPTAPTLANAVAEIGSGIAGPDVVVKPKVVLLITDGDPNCSNGSGNGVDTQARQDTIANIQTLTSNGVRTFVVGFQTAGSSFAGVMDMMAAAGGTGATAHTSVASEAELNDVLETLIGKAISCTFTLDEAPPDPSYVLVKLDGKPLNLNQDDGWRLGPDGKTVEIVGESCATLEVASTAHTLEVSVQCEVVPIF